MPYNVNGEAVQLPEPVITDGTTFVPCADLANALGGYADWDNTAKIARIEIGDRVGHIHNGSSSVEVNGTTYDMKAEPYIETTTSTLWVPVRVFRDAYGLTLSVDGESVTISRF